MSLRGLFDSAKAAVVEPFTGNLDSEALKAKILASEHPIVKHHFGWVGGDVYFIKPSSNTDLNEIFKELDRQPEARKSRSGMRWMVGPVLSSRSGEDALYHHKIFKKVLTRHKEFVAFTMAALKEQLEKISLLSIEELPDLETFTTQTVRQILGRGLFGVEHLPDDLISAFNGFMSRLKSPDMTGFAANNFFMLIGIYYPSLLERKKAYREARDAYMAAASRFIESQFEAVKYDILSYSMPDPSTKTAQGGITNIISLSVIELLMEKEPALRTNELALESRLAGLEDTEIIALLSDPYICTLPANIMAGTNLVETIATVLCGLAKDPAMLAQLREMLSHRNLLADFSNIQEIIDADRRDQGLLEQMYLEGVRLRSINEDTEKLALSHQLRYFISQETTILGVKIPKGSLISVLNSIPSYDQSLIGEKPDAFIPARFFANGETQRARITKAAFSHGVRLCPGHLASDYVAKTLICYLAAKHDLHLVEKEKVGYFDDVKLALVPPTTLRVEKRMTS